MLDALEQTIWTRQDRQDRYLTGLVHHSDHGSPYLSITYTGRLIDEGIEASAEALGKPYKRELAWRDGP